MVILQSTTLGRYLLFWTIAFLAFAGLATAQVDQGAISGNVQDQTGALVQGATVTLLNEDTALTFTTTTASDGNYSFNPIKIGSYAVTVEKQGFSKTSQSHIGVNVGAQVKANFKLTPGEVSQTVEVTSALPLLQTQTSTVGQDVTNQQVSDLPLNSATGRNYTFLAQISPGVTSNKSRVAGTGGFTANGLQWSHNSYLLDGIDNNNNEMDFLNGAAYVTLTPPDGIQEVKVQTSNFNAEYGRAGSAVINAITKSGTNDFHGDVWEYFQNDALNANSFFNNRNRVVKPRLRFNQFGGTLGGPIEAPHIYNGHNKSFFFVDYQGTRIRQQDVRTATVPTAQQRNSGFANFQDLILLQNGSQKDVLGRTLPTGSILHPATTRTVTANVADPVTGLVATKTGFVRDPFFQGSVVGITDYTTSANKALMNVLPAGRLDPNAIKLLSAYPAANQIASSVNNFGLSNNYIVKQPHPDDDNHFDARVDHNFSEKNQIFGRFSYDTRLRNILQAFTGPIDNSGFGNGNFDSKSWSSALSYTHLFSPTMINEARVGFSRLTDNALPAIASAQGIAAQFGIQGAPQGPNLGGLPLINISGLTGVGPGEFASPDTRVSNTVQLTENLTKVYGSHTFKGGFETQFIRFAFSNPRDPRGRMDFRGNYSGIAGTGQLGSGMADLLLTPTKSTVPNGIDFEGGPGFVIADSLAAPDSIRHYYGAYFQDDWKVAHNLTLNLGLRWEFFGHLRNHNGAEAIFAPGRNQTPAAYIISSSQKNVPLATSFTNLLAKDNIALQYSDVPGLLQTPTHDFAPRVGLAYQITRNLVMRSSYGIFYAGFENLGGSPDPGTNYPFAVEPSLNDASQGAQTMASQNPASFPSGGALTFENALTFVTPIPTSPAFNPVGSGFNAFAPDWKTGQTQEWSLFFQYALSQHDSIQAGYVGNHSVHLINGWRVNSPTQIIPNNAGLQNKNFSPWPDFGLNQNYVIPNGDGYYRGLQITYERRFSDLNVLANFTRALCMTDIRNVLNDNTVGGNQRAAWLPGFGLKGDYGACADNAQRVFHVATTWRLPFGKGRRFGRDSGGIANQILGGWVVNGILTMQDGFPGNVGCQVSTTQDYGCVADVVPHQPLYSQIGPHGIDHFLNVAAFTQPCALKPNLTPDPTSVTNPNFPGNCEQLTGLAVLGGTPQQFQGPGFNNLDFSLFKEFPLNERTRFELRGEFFNVFNHPNFGLPGNLNYRQDPTASTFNFANITSTVGNPRQTQVALKFFW